MKFLDGLRAPLHISHRGGAALAPENTLPAFERAVREFHTDVLELDVHATKDQVVVVAHDATLDRCTTARGPLRERTFEELQTIDAGAPGVHLPSLEQVLTAFPHVRINVEVKVADALEPFVQLVKRLGVIDRLCMGSEHDELGAELHRLLPEACHFFPTNALAGLVLPLKGGDVPELDPRYRVLDMPLRWEGVQMFDAELARFAKAHGLWINVWTVDDEADMRAAIADGVGGVMTDRPDVLRRVIDELRAAPHAP